ncbi:hypothetical protein PBCV1_a102L [Paramecium bursaria Chlorella virus 1]|uniref:Uncharacterized protein n=1 Tax=Paramecium bursaria Chlorella virus 1 TaxID=10506 RepID=Q84423_PBCV1|nr:hypothetical protein PBCV1_a102L [Paramecium bursaria Chlorella virus 1]AAC96470.1 hypothetical protein [Paramecium bursaria Chlorella virus 1]
MFLKGRRYTVIARSIIVHTLNPKTRVKNIMNRIPSVFSDTTYLFCFNFSKSFRSMLTGLGPGSLGNLWSSIARSFILATISSRDSPTTLCSFICRPLSVKTARSVVIFLPVLIVGGTIFNNYVFRLTLNLYYLTLSFILPGSNDEHKFKFLKNMRTLTLGTRYQNFKR